MTTPNICIAACLENDAAAVCFVELNMQSELPLHGLSMWSSTHLVSLYARLGCSVHMHDHSHSMMQGFFPQKVHTATLRNNKADSVPGERAAKGWTGHFAHCVTRSSHSQLGLPQLSSEGWQSSWYAMLLIDQVYVGLATI